MAKKQAKSMVYFVLYIVLLSELLIVITERDEYEEMERKVRDSMVVNIGEALKQPLVLQVDKLTSREKGNKEYTAVNLKAIGLVSREERNTIKYTINVVKGTRVPPGWPSDGLTIDNPTEIFKIERDPDGGGKFYIKLDAEGEFKFVAYCEVTRQVPSYLPDFLQAALSEKMGEHKDAKSENETFNVTVTTKGVQKLEMQRL